MSAPRTLHERCGSSKALTATKAALSERGVEVLATTNEWEVLRFRSRHGTGVVYRRANGMFTSNPEAMVTFGDLSRAGSLAPVPIARRRGGKGKRAGIISALIERDGPGCFFCGHAMAPIGEPCAPGTQPTVEHLVSIAHGGPDHISNKFAAHDKCNRLAGHLSAPEKIAMRDQMRASS